MTLEQLHAERRALLRRRRLSQARDTTCDARLRSVLAQIDALELPVAAAASKALDAEVDALEQRALRLTKP